MNLFIYDIEVFAYDWIVVARRPEKGANHIVIHNDNYRLREFFETQVDIVGGFNNKHYDDYVVMTMMNGGSNVEVKRCNDFIIVDKQKPWTFPFIQFKKKPFKSFDLKDDIPDKALSLKAIEGNLRCPIVESSVDFLLDRPLTPSELAEVIKYCKTDVDRTCDLYWQRKADYLDAKVMVGEMYGIDPLDAMGYTNAKLSSIVLEAEYTPRDDERDYVPHPCLDRSKIPDAVWNFFDLIHDKSIPDAKLFGEGKGKKGMSLSLIIKTARGSCPVTYAWGGVHGAKPCVIIECTKDRVIINFDVASLYPNSMINFGYTSRSMKDPDAYKKLVKKRLEYKKAGDKMRANALKLVVNTVYGAMLSEGNGLMDRLSGRSVCITNQLAMTMLITDLAKSCESIDFVNINTDGIMFTIDRSEVELSEKIVNDWCEITGFEMERDDFQKVIQKDVNNYIGIKPDGHFKTKGGFVSLYDGGSFKTNSLQIIHKAIVDYLVKNIDPEVTIRNCTDVTAFQQIVKTGGTFEGSFHYIDGERVPTQKVNRIYAVSDPRYGAVVKGKWIKEKRKKNKSTGKMDIIPVDPPVWSESVVPECPEHTFIDNENTLTVADLDLEYYIDIARKRIDRYINIDPDVAKKISKIKLEVSIMAEKNQTVQLTNLYQKLLEARVRFRESGVKKTGKNTYAAFKYFTLDDIIPKKQEIFRDLGLCDVISFGTEVATLTIYNADNPEEFIEFMSNLAPDESLIKNPIQKVGAIETYVRRYLYLLALDIIESDAVEAVTGKDEEETTAPKQSEAPKTEPKKAPPTAEDREDIKNDLIGKDEEATKPQRTAISNALKKLRARYMDADMKVTDEELEQKYSGYIKSIAKKVKSGITKAEADAILVEIGKKIVE